VSNTTELLGHFDASAIAGVVGRIERMKRGRRDYLYPAPRLSMRGGRLVLSGKVFRVAPDGGLDGGICFTEWADAEAAADACGGRVVPEEAGAIGLNATAEGQLADKLGVPMKFVKHLKEGKHGDLLDHNVTTLLARDKRRFFVRTLAGDGGTFARAFLGDGYRVMDNADLFFAAAEEFERLGVSVQKARLWGDGDHFELFAFAPHIAGQVRLDRPFDPGDGWLSRWKGGEGDAQNAGIRISNSETGDGGLRVRPCVLTRVCQNYCIWGTTVSQIHLGRRREEEGLVLAEDTLALEARLTWSKVRDAIRTAFDVGRFREYIARMNDATTQTVPDPERAVGNVVREFSITEDRKASILSRLLGFGDRSRYGLVQAVTYAAHEADRLDRPAEASVLEEAGGKLLEMADTQFAALVR
jgi:hypothetical protein